jgi:phosphoglycolate phosphatase
VTSEYIESGGRWWGTPPEVLLRDASCLLWDFDGPLCRLFAHHPAREVVVTLCDELVGLGLPAEAAKWWGSHDPHRILRSGLAREVVAVLEDRTAEEEEEAASTAEPTPGADGFVRMMIECGRLLAVTTNNAPRAVAAYLKAHDLDDCFGSRIFGRNASDPHRMKPDPDCLLRAVEALDVAPSECLMIGDSAMDAKAAAAAGVPFLGYARNEERSRRLQEGADVPYGVIGMGPLHRAAHELLLGPRPPRHSGS